MPVKHQVRNKVLDSISTEVENQITHYYTIDILNEILDSLDVPVVREVTVQVSAARSSKNA